MKKIFHSILAVAVFLLLSAGLQSCEKQICEDLLLNDLKLDDLELNELVVLPCNPDSEDQISIIELICGTESDVILSFQGNVIGYKRYVNSLMMAPCIPQFDTTVIGQLDKGSYQLIQSVIDLNHQISDSIIRQDTITLHVSK
jgi:hypothetical protein